VDERPIASHLLPVLARIGHWLYPVHFAFLPGFWGEPEQGVLIEEGASDEEFRRAHAQ
jgi:hypothetical protein